MDFGGADAVPIAVRRVDAHRGRHLRKHVTNYFQSRTPDMRHLLRWAEQELELVKAATLKAARRDKEASLHLNVIDVVSILLMTA